jgi:phospholipid/cholesterol/gamma-HCH transport system ATP-binding protein
MIQINNVCKRFGAQVVLDGVKLEVKEGETLALLGPSGTGKSVLLKSIIGLIKPDRGEIIVDGQNVYKLKRDALSKLRATIGYVFQNGALFDSMNVYENIRLGLTDHDQYNDEKFAHERAAETLRLVNLNPETLTKMPSDLSGGMRKRVGIARAIAGKPKYVLYDEPTSGLDPINSDIIDALVKRLERELGVTSITVTHDVRGAFRTADRIALLTKGKIVAIGPVEEFRNSEVPEVKAFLERDFESAPLPGAES